MKTAQRKTISERSGIKLGVDEISNDGIPVAQRYFVSKPKPGHPGVIEQHYFDHRDQAERAFSAAGTLTRQATGPRPYWWQHESTDWYLGPSLPRYQPL